MVMNCERGEHESAKSYVLRVLIDSIGKRNWNWRSGV